MVCFYVQAGMTQKYEASAMNSLDGETIQFILPTILEGPVEVIYHIIKTIVYTSILYLYIMYLYNINSDNGASLSYSILKATEPRWLYTCNIATWLYYRYVINIFLILKIDKRANDSEGRTKEM